MELISVISCYFKGMQAEVMQVEIRLVSPTSMLAPKEDMMYDILVVHKYHTVQIVLHQ